jgi:hypothetical protein
MTATVKKLLEAFDKLSEAEKHELLAQVIRRTVGAEYGSLTDEELTLVAEERFLERDKEEAVHE